jgi:hypothetical protein
MFFYNRFLDEEALNLFRHAEKASKNSKDEFLYWFIKYQIGSLLGSLEREPDESMRMLRSAFEFFSTHRLDIVSGGLNSMTAVACGNNFCSWLIRRGEFVEAEAVCRQLHKEHLATILKDDDALHCFLERLWYVYLDRNHGLDELESMLLAALNLSHKFWGDSRQYYLPVILFLADFRTHTGTSNTLHYR